MSEASLAALDQAASALIDALRTVDEARQQLRGAPVANVGPAPFFLNSASTAAILTGRTGPGVVAVPVAPIALVDRPRRSEDPRLAKANDDTPLERPAPAPVEPPKLRGRLAHVNWDPVVWDAFVAGYLKGHTISWAREVCLSLARERGFAMPKIEAFRRKLRREGVTRPAEQTSEITATGLSNPDIALGEGQAPEGTSGAVEHGGNDPGNACQTRSPAGRRERGFRLAPADRSLGVGSDRPDAPLPDEPEEEPAEAPDVDDDDIDQDFAVALKRVRERKAGALRPKTKPDYARFVAARVKAPTPPPARSSQRPLRPADSREECKRCGVPGWKGCDHQLPYDEAAR